MSRQPVVASRTAAAFAVAVIVFVGLLPGAARAANHNVDVSCCSFTPAYLEIQQGDTVTWNWTDFALHTVTSGLSSNPADNPGALFDTPQMTFGATFVFQFNNPGNVPYFCRPHELPPFNMKGTIVVRCANPDTSCRAGNVDTGGGGAPVDVLFVNGSAGTPPEREVIVTANTQVAITINKPPAGGTGLYVFWIAVREPCVGDATPAVLNTNAGMQAIGTSCFCLPVNNTVMPGSCPCSLYRELGRVSRSILGAPTAAALCVPHRVANPRAPTTFMTSFRPGIYAVLGAILDPNSASGPKPVSLTNTVVIVARP